MAPRGGQDAQNNEKEHRPNEDRSMTQGPPPCWAKKLPTCLQVGFPKRTRINKNRYKCRSKKWNLSRLIFETLLLDFGKENGSKVAQKSIKNRRQLQKVISWKTVLSLKRGLDFWGFGVEIGSKNRSKIIQKLKSTWEGILARIFNGFWWILGVRKKIEPRSIKNGIEKAIKMKGNTMAKESQQEAQTTHDTWRPKPCGGGRGEVEACPRGDRDGRSVPPA